MKTLGIIEGAMHKQGMGLYRLTVRVDEQSKKKDALPQNIVVHQYIKKDLFPNTRVEVLLKDDQLYVKEVLHSVNKSFKKPVS